MKWQDVRMPDQIARLPRDHRGFPVPYVSDWSHEGSGMIDTGRVMLNDCNCTIGKGVPDLGHQCPVRQRECMTRRKCEVCGQKIPPNAMVAFMGGLDSNSFTEPCMHIECAHYSASVCPGIRSKPFGITFAHKWELFGQYHVGIDPISGDLATVYVPLTEDPPDLFVPGKKAVLNYYLAKPVAIRKLPVSDWLAQYAMESV